MSGLEILKSFTKRIHLKPSQERYLQWSDDLEQAWLWKRFHRESQRWHCVVSFLKTWVRWAPNIGIWLRLSLSPRFWFLRPGRLILKSYWVRTFPVNPGLKWQNVKIKFWCFGQWSKLWSYWKISRTKWETCKCCDSDKCILMHRKMPRDKNCWFIWRFDHERLANGCSNSWLVPAHNFCLSYRWKFENNRFQWQEYRRMSHFCEIRFYRNCWWARSR